ncbi:hypothetical protein Nepgr_000726 [Nepenthes gracilis]|uniref:CCHC-type domain-containing protein n=1 Tax=Nepenthes gracilis TaxID=150966 RepID=A0AAD3P467_NEPGR|nr:hypothetical protein Nepgr_000726 [Nepenthes gracilis]
MSDAGAAVPTGCYKCGRPGHWSRDCPSSSSTKNSNPNFDSTVLPPKTSNFTSSTFPNGGDTGSKDFLAKPIGRDSSTQKPKKVPRTRPKLTPELLLSDDGLGYILRYFPRNFKYRGRGHEVGDLRNLLHMYSEWHSQLLPYYSFDQFVKKVEQVGSTKRVKSCLGDLREKVSTGGDPTKWNEQKTEHEATNNLEDSMDLQEPSHCQGRSSPKDGKADEVQEDLLNEIYNQTVEEASQTLQGNTPYERTSGKDSPGEDQGKGDRSFNPIQVTEDQKARMEASRLKALEKANAKARILPAA